MTMQRLLPIKVVEPGTRWETWGYERSYAPGRMRIWRVWLRCTRWAHHA